jgi:hypothetical protein
MVAVAAAAELLLLFLLSSSSSLCLFYQAVFPELFKLIMCIFNDIVIAVALKGYNV